MRFGVQYNGVSMASVMGPLEFAERAEAWGYDAYFVPDLENLPALDPLTLLAAVSQCTERLELGTGVLALPFRSPYQLAKVAVSIDMLSNSRLNLGLGTGMFPQDFHVEQRDFRKRGSITNEYLSVLRPLLDGETVTHHGTYYSIDNVSLAPKPTRRISIWLGGTWNDGFSQAALRRAAQYADTFHPHEVPAARYAETIQTIANLAEGYGRDPSSITYACNMWLCLGDSKASAMDEVRTAMEIRFGDEAWDIAPDSCIAYGAPSDAIEIIQGFADAGVSTFVMNVLSLSEHVIENVQGFAREVIPRLRG